MRCNKIYTFHTRAVLVRDRSQPDTDHQHVVYLFIVAFPVFDKIIQVLMLFLHVFMLYIQKDLFEFFSRQLLVSSSELVGKSIRTDIKGVTRLELKFVGLKI